jgi:hypothetical protein
MLAHAGMWRCATRGANLRVQCGHGTLSSGPDVIFFAIWSSTSLVAPLLSAYFIWRETLIAC